MKKILALSMVFLMATFGVKAPEALAGTNQVFSWTYGQNFDNTQDTYNLPLGGSGVSWTTTEADVTYKVKNPFVIKDFSDAPSNYSRGRENGYSNHPKKRSGYSS